HVSRSHYYLPYLCDSPYTPPFFFFTAPPPPPLSPLSLHDALPIYPLGVPGRLGPGEPLLCLGDLLAHLAEDRVGLRRGAPPGGVDRKITRLNSSHDQISYAVFCLKKKKKTNKKR